MKNFKAWLTERVWIGSLGVAAMLMGWTPACKAQEVSPAIFTESGVEDVYPVAKPVAKKAVKVQTVAHADQGATGNKVDVRKQNGQRVARKTVVTTPGL